MYLKYFSESFVLKSRLSLLKKISYSDIQFHYKITYCILDLNNLSLPCTCIACLSGLTLNCKSSQIYLGVVSPGAVSCAPMYVQSSIMDCLCSCLLQHHSGRSVLNILLSMKLQEST